VVVQRTLSVKTRKKGSEINDSVLNIIQKEAPQIRKNFSHVLSHLTNTPLLLKGFIKCGRLRMDQIFQGIPLVFRCSIYPKLSLSNNVLIHANA